MRHGAVYHQVRVAADGAGEVRVVLEGQAIVPDVLRAVDGLAHAADGDLLEDVLLLGALDRTHQLVDRLGQVLRPSVGLQVVPEALGQYAQLLHFFRVWQVMDAVHERRGTPLATADPGRHAFVRQQHELLDQPVCGSHHFLVHLDGAALFVQFEFHLVATYFQRAVVHALLPQDLRELVQCEHLVLELALTAVDESLCFGIGKSPVAVHDGAAEPFAVQAGFVIDLENGAEAEFVRVRVQRAEVVTEVLWQHGHHAVHQIDAGSASCGLLVH